MTIQEFKLLCENACKEKGLISFSVSVSAMAQFDGVFYFSSVRIKDLNKTISSKMQSNPLASIEALKDAIDFELKTYIHVKTNLEI